MIRTRIRELFGYACAGCGRPCETAICQHCLIKIEKPKFYCNTCGIALIAQSQNNICKSCILNPPSFRSLEYLANYNGLIAQLIVEAKVARQAKAVNAIKYLINQNHNKHCNHLEQFKDYHLLPMPIPLTRHISRGFNLPLIIAKELARLNTIKIVSSNVVKLPIMSVKQAKLSKKQRQMKMHNFVIRSKIAKKIIIIDDVVTSSKTIENLSHTLKEQGVEEIAIWTLARTQ